MLTTINILIAISVMIYSFMRLILFFDLPMVTKADVRIYTHFHKYLVQEGYIMMQYSIYCKLFPNREAAVKHVDILKRNVPVEGHVRVMMVTEKQYSKMVLLTGSKSHQESSINSDAFIII